MTKLKLLFLLAATMPAVSWTHAQETPFSAKEIQETWVGKSVIGTTGTGAPVVLKMLPDGTASVQVGKTSDTGTWRLSESGYCATWKNIRAGTERCLTVQRAGSQFKVLNPDGSVNSVVSEVK